MGNIEKDNSITKKDLNNLADRLEKNFNERLGQFTDDVLLPAISEIVRKEIGAHRYDMKVYIDSKMSENKGDIIAYIKPITQKDKEWKRIVIDVLEKHKLARQEELKRLCDLVALR